MHPKKAGFLNILQNVKTSKDLNNGFLLEKGFSDWTKDYLETHPFSSYVDKIDNYFRLVEVITIEEIKDSLNYEGMEKVRVLLDGFQLSLERNEQKLFGVETLDMKYYKYNQFLYSIMLMFYELDSATEIDKRVTFLTQWLEDVSFEADSYYRKNQKILDAIAFQDKHK